MLAFQAVDAAKLYLTPASAVPIRQPRVAPIAGSTADLVCWGGIGLAEQEE